MNDDDGAAPATLAARGRSGQGGRAAIVAAIVAALAGAGAAELTRSAEAAQDVNQAAPARPPSEGTAKARTAGPNVRLTFKVIPPRRATVSWGKQKLGIIKPGETLVIQRPRDSGPMDLQVRADGCLTVHTRAYTFTDTVIAVKVTEKEEKHTIYGYREELPPEDGGAPDGGGALRP
jgi:hypothetical protein